MQLGSQNAFVFRAVLITFHLAVGRAVEVGLVAYTSALWDFDQEKLLFPWVDINTGKIVMVSF